MTPDRLWRVWRALSGPDHAPRYLPAPRQPLRPVTGGASRPVGRAVRRAFLTVTTSAPAKPASRFLFQ
jgi:hypothetical protein